MPWPRRGPCSWRKAWLGGITCCSNLVGPQNPSVETTPAGEASALCALHAMGLSSYAMQALHDEVLAYGLGLLMLQPGADLETRFVQTLHCWLDRECDPSVPQAAQAGVRAPSARGTCLVAERPGLSQSAFSVAHAVAAVCPIHKRFPDAARRKRFPIGAGGLPEPPDARHS